MKAGEVEGWAYLCWASFERCWERKRAGGGGGYFSS